MQRNGQFYIFFWVFPRRQIVVGRRFGTLYQFHLQRLGVQCTLYTQHLKMELIQGSETSANHNLTPGKYPEENIQYSNHGESLKSRMVSYYNALLPLLR